MDRVPSDQACHMLFPLTPRQWLRRAESTGHCQNVKNCQILQINTPFQESPNAGSQGTVVDPHDEVAGELGPAVRNDLLVEGGRAGRQVTLRPCAR